ncbi:MAG: hypothetical protein IJY91_06885 [Oscillospiraceae bacterium]|nr:hypothetical protein [Oscillospiraceae bacterium]
MEKYIKVLCLLMAMALLFAGCGKPQAQTGPANETQGGITPATDPTNGDPTEPSIPLNTAPEDEPYVEPPTQPPVQVVMPDYELSYSGEMAEVIFWEELAEESGLQFSVKLSSGNAVLFTLLLDQVEGELVTMKENTAGEQIPVSFLMEAVPEGLSEEDLQTYCVAQDKVNEILASLVLK